MEFPSRDDFLDGEAKREVGFYLDPGKAKMGLQGSSRCIVAWDVSQDSGVQARGVGIAGERLTASDVCNTGRKSGSRLHRRSLFSFAEKISRPRFVSLRE
jgi:hypothetical protein